MYTKLDTRHAEERLRLSYFKTLDVHNNKYTILLWYRVASRYMPSMRTVSRAKGRPSGQVRSPTRPLYATTLAIQPTTA